jgi:hypothetical protein
MTPGEVFDFYRMLISSAGNGKTASQEALAGWCLLHKPSFRLPQHAASDKLLLFRMLKRLLNSRNTENPVTVVEGGEKHVAVFDNRNSSLSMRVAHLKANTTTQPSIYISRYGLLYQPLNFIQYLRAISLAFRLLVVKGPSIQKALLLNEVFEASALLRVLRENGISYLHFYSPFEKDANALTLLLRKHGVHVNKLPSPSLLGAHHQELITDTLSLGSPYQADELEAYRPTHYIKNIQHFTPERWADYGHLYESPPAAPPNSIGFYSHGVWLREAEGHKDSGFGDHHAEKQAIEAIANYLRNRPGIKLIIFLHPRERKADLAARTRTHYNQIFKGIDYEFSDATKPGTLQFDAVDVGFGGISTILFERLFAARKTVFFPAGVDVFPLPESKISTICPITTEALFPLLDKSFQLQATQWLHEFDVVGYTAGKWLHS